MPCEVARTVLFPPCAARSTAPISLSPGHPRRHGYTPLLSVWLLMEGPRACAPVVFVNRWCVVVWYFTISCGAVPCLARMSVRVSCGGARAVIDVDSDSVYNVRCALEPTAQKPLMWAEAGGYAEQKGPKCSGAVWTSAGVAWRPSLRRACIIWS